VRSLNFNRTKQILHELFYFKKLLKKYRKSLRGGQYRLFESVRAIALNDPEIMASAKKYFDKKVSPSKTTAIVAKLNSRGFYKVKAKGDWDKFDAIYSANNHDKKREIKLFSFERKEILTVCTSAEACKKQLNEYEKWHSCFGMPSVTACEKYPDSYIISMVSLCTRPQELNALAHIARRIAEYHKAHSADTEGRPIGDILTFSYDSAEMNDTLARLSSNIDPCCLAAVPYCLQHGDLSRDNLIYGECDNKTDFWWIDWEHARARSFFYDYFFYILNTAVFFKDTEALNAYLSGEADPHLADFFADFGLKFLSEHRKDYFMIFAIEFLKERVCDKQNTDALKMYSEYIEKNILNKE